MDEGSSAGLGLVLMAAGLGAQALAHVAQLAASRGSELLADRAAAEAYGADALISALTKIDAAAARAPRDLRASAEAGLMAHAMFSGGSDGAAAFAMPSGFGLQTVGRMVGRRLERLPGVKRVGLNCDSHSCSDLLRVSVDDARAAVSLDGRC